MLTIALFNPLAMHERDKTILRSIGHASGVPSIGRVEVHPMTGRCFRQPFGQDYVVITPDGPLHLWQQQLNYYLHDRRTPSFGRIVYELLQLSQRAYDASLTPTANVAKYPSLVKERHDEVIEWARSGYEPQKVESPTLVAVGSSKGILEPSVAKVVELQRDCLQSFCKPPSAS